MAVINFIIRIAPISLSWTSHWRIQCLLCISTWVRSL